MKEQLKDVTFLILIRLDSVERLENLVTVVNQIYRYFETDIIVLECWEINSGILNKLLGKKTKLLFYEDKDPVFYKTKYINQAVCQINSPIIALWDADIVVDKSAILDAVLKLREKTADISYPYNGVCLETPALIRRLFLKYKSTALLHKNKNKMRPLYQKFTVGGAVFVNKEKYVYAGMENEHYYGWGNDDYDRYYRFVKLNLKIYRTDTCLFHLSHPRGTNSGYRSSYEMRLSAAELIKTKKSTAAELLSYYNRP